MRHRILIDGTAARFGGTAYAIVHLAQELARSSSVEEVHVVVREGSIVARGLAGREPVRLTLLRPASTLELPRRIAWQAVRLRELVRSSAATVLITPAGMLPVDPGVPVVSYLLNPVAFQDGGVANRIRRWAIRRTSVEATVLVPSEHQRDLVETALGRPVDVVALGVATDRFGPADVPGEELLCVADFYRHKRHDVLIEAWRALPTPRPRLRLIGDRAVDPEWAAQVEARATAASTDDGDCVTLEGGLSLAELADAYRAARAFVLASERESFCMPLAEAVVSGVPGVVRDLPVLRETGGPGCRYVSSDDPDHWAAVVAEMIGGGETHATLRTAGLQHASQFTFARMADGIRTHLPSSSPSAHSAPRPFATAFAVAALLLLALVSIAAVAARDVETPKATASVPRQPPPSEPGVTYGPGLQQIARAPSRDLARVLGDRWHRLLPPVGRLNVVPTGTRSPAYAVSAVITAPAPARLQLVTARGEKALASVTTRPAPQIFGPFRTLGSGPQGLALYPIARSSPGPGPALLVSPVDAHFLKVGDALLPSPSLRPRDPQGRPAFVVRSDDRTSLRFVPLRSKTMSVILDATAQRGRVRVRASAGGVTHAAGFGSATGAVRLGPFPSRPVVRFTFTPSAGTAGWVYVTRVQLVPR